MVMNIAVNAAGRPPHNGRRCQYAGQITIYSVNLSVDCQRSAGQAFLVCDFVPQIINRNVIAAHYRRSSVSGLYRIVNNQFYLRIAQRLKRRDAAATVYRCLICKTFVRSPWVACIYIKIAIQTFSHFCTFFQKMSGECSPLIVPRGTFLL